MKEKYLKILFTYNSSMFKGRASRKEYIMCSLYYMLLSIPAIILTMLIPVGVLFFLYTSIPCAALVFRRLHDINLSGYFIILGAIPYVNIILYLIFILVPGYTKKNQYGDPPIL